MGDNQAYLRVVGILNELTGPWRKDAPEVAHPLCQTITRIHDPYRDAPPEKLPWNPFDNGTCGMILTLPQWCIYLGDRGVAWWIPRAPDPPIGPLPSFRRSVLRHRTWTLCQRPSPGACETS